MKRDIETIGLVASVAFASTEPYLAAVGEMSFTGSSGSLSSKDSDGNRVPLTDLANPGDRLVVVGPSGNSAIVLGAIDRTSADRINFTGVTASRSAVPFPIGEQVTLCLVKEFDPNSILTDGEDVLLDGDGNVLTGGV